MPYGVVCDEGSNLKRLAREFGVRDTDTAPRSALLDVRGRVGCSAIVRGEATQRQTFLKVGILFIHVFIQ